MKKLIFIVPVQLKEDGTLSIKKIKSLQMIAGFLRDRYEITLLIQSHREKRASGLSDLRVTVIYDNSTPEYQTDISHCGSRFQSSYLRWAGRKLTGNKEVFRSEYDCLIAWDGCSPWCLATALQLVTAKRRFAWVYDDPNLYLMPEDYSFYADLCSGFDAIFGSETDIKHKLDSICEGASLKGRSIVVNLPVAVSWYWEQSKKRCACEFQENNINLLAVSKMSRESALERLPGWLSQHRDHRPPPHCYLLGDGERLDRYIQQIAVHSVDDMVTLVGQTENPYPYVRRCDALIVGEGGSLTELELAAQIYGVPLVAVENLELYPLELKKKKAPDEPLMPAWRDKDQLIKILEEK